MGISDLLSWRRSSAAHYRRFYLDFFLDRFCADLAGTVLELGPKRSHRRGKFRNAVGGAGKFYYFNVARTVAPSAVSDTQALAVADGAADHIVCTEVLEHIPEPERCLGECLRVLKSGGSIFASTPFLFPVHGAPEDYQRWTRNGLQFLFERAGFRNIRIYSMGGVLGTLGMLAERAAVKGQSPRPLSWLACKATIVLARAMQSIDLLRVPRAKHLETSIQPAVTTGYFVIAEKQ
jgi:SAM-dependent methyltransferase